MKLRGRNVLAPVLLMFAVGCGGGGGTTCSDDKPLECPGGTCCARGYPYSCGDGYCYQYGCPAGSPNFNVCEFKVANTNVEKQSDEVPVIDEEQANSCVPEGYPEEEISAQDDPNE
jgi:hypothetical protein